MDVVTDGEMRRLSFQSGLPDAVDGFGDVPLEAYLWGDWHGDDVGDRATARPAGLGVGAPAPAAAHRRRGLHLPARPRDRDRKVTLASPSLYANLWSPEVSRDAYPTLDEFLEDVAGSSAPRSTSFTGSAAPTSSSTRPLPAPDRSGHAGVLRGPGLDRRPLARPRHRARQLRHGRPPRGHLRLPSVPRQPGQPLAGRGRLRADRAPGLPRRQRRPAAARVRRRAVGLIPAAARGARRQGGRARPRHDQVAAARDRRGADRPDPRGRPPHRSRAARHQPAVRFCDVGARECTDAR